MLRLLVSLCRYKNGVKAVRHKNFLLLSKPMINNCRDDWQKTLCSIHLCNRFFSQQGGEKDDAVSKVLEHEMGIDPKLHQGILKALESMHGGKVGVDHLITLGKQDLTALAATTQPGPTKRSKNKVRPSVPLQIQIPDGHNTSCTLKWKLGDSLLHLARQNRELLGEHLEGTCGGNMSCCTCHVYIEQTEFRAFLNDPAEAEMDMLDLAFEPTESSRLGCQVRLSPQMVDAPINFQIRIPNGVNNVYQE